MGERAFGPPMGQGANLRSTSAELRTSTDEAGFVRRSRLEKQGYGWQSRVHGAELRL